MIHIKTNRFLIAFGRTVIIWHFVFKQVKQIPLYTRLYSKPYADETEMLCWRQSLRNWFTNPGVTSSSSASCFWVISNFLKFSANVFPHILFISDFFITFMLLSSFPQTSWHKCNPKDCHSGDLSDNQIPSTSDWWYFLICGDWEPTAQEGSPQICKLFYYLIMPYLM